MAEVRAVRFVKLSQICLYGFLAICTILLPHFLFERNEGGVSNFGVHALTIIPYTLAFGLGGYYLIRAAIALPKHTRSRQMLHNVLLTLGALTLLLLITTYPYQLTRTLDNIHILVAQLYFVTQLLAAIWFATNLSKNKTNYLLLTIVTVGSLLALLTILGFLHMLFLSQILTGAAFAILLIRTITAATRE